MFQIDTSVFGNINSKADYDRQKEELKRQKQMQNLQMMALQKQVSATDTSPEQLLAKAIQLGGVENLSPAEQAQLQAADIAQRTKQSVDPRGNVITNRSYFDLLGMPAGQVAQMSPSVMRGQGIVPEVGQSTINAPRMGQRMDSGMISPTMQTVPNTGDFIDVASQPDLPMDGLPMDMVDPTQVNQFQGLPIPPEPDYSGLSPYSAEDARQKYLEDVRKVQMENAKLKREAESNFGKIEGQVSLINNTIDNLLDNKGNLKPGVGQAVGGFLGLQGLQASIMPLTKAQRDVKPFIDQLQGQAFLQAFESLKGGGQITEIEGLKAERAIARLQQTQSDEGFAKALKDLRDVANAAKNRAAKQAGKGAQLGNKDPLGIR